MRRKLGAARWSANVPCTETVLSRRGYQGGVPLGKATPPPKPKGQGQ